MKRFAFDANAALARAMEVGPEPKPPNPPNPPAATVAGLGRIGQIGCEEQTSNKTPPDAADQVWDAAAERALKLAARTTASPEVEELILLGLILRDGPQSHGGAASHLGWGSTRAWQAEERLQSLGLVCRDEFGRMSLAASCSAPHHASNPESDPYAFASPELAEAWEHGFRPGSERDAFGEQ